MISGVPGSLQPIHGLKVKNITPTGFQLVRPFENLDAQATSQIN